MPLISHADYACTTPCYAASSVKVGVKADTNESNTGLFTEVKSNRGTPMASASQDS
jgi:hypothetical protein